jgi:hypothetical protein
VLTYPITASSPPVITGYTVTSYSIATSSDINTLQVNLMKTNFRVSALQNASKYSMNNMVIDTFTDETGINKSLSNYLYDTTNKAVQNLTPITYYDDFLSTVPAIWTAGNGATLSIVSGKLAIVGTASGTPYAKYNQNFSKRMFAKATTVTTNQGTESWLYFHDSAASFGTKFYRLGFQSVSGTFYYRLHYFDGSTMTTLYSASAPGAATYAMDVDPVTGKMTAWVNDVQVYSGTPNASAFASGAGYFCVLAYGSSGTAETRMDSFTLRDMSQPATVTLLSTTDTLALPPVRVVVSADEVLNGGGVKGTYYVSRDNGVTWMNILLDTLTDISSLPSGNSFVLKLVTSGGAQGDYTLNSWGYSWA